MSKHNVRGTASGEYECSCGARWDRDEGSECPLGRIDGKQVKWQNEAMENARVAALNGTLPETKEVVSAGDERAAFEAACENLGLTLYDGSDCRYAKEIQCAWMLWQARAALSCNHTEKQAKDAPYMSDDADPRETWAQGYNAAMQNA